MSKQTFPQVKLRSPDMVMRLDRMGVSFPTRLSFLRSIVRQLSQEKAQVRCPVWKIDADGYGHAVYEVELGGYVYSLVAVATELSPENRTDRVIAQAWDAAFVLYDGSPTEDEIARIKASAPRQEAARFTERDLILSRANKSVRLFAHIVSALKIGQEPDRAMIRDTGYLMRTTAVYGNGKFGIADRYCIEWRPGLDGPFAAEMLTVWMIRGFTHDLVEHLGGAKLDRDLKRHLGIGNATGLGMAPFLVSHPELLNNWVMARETALARVRALVDISDSERAELKRLANRAEQHLLEWSVPDAHAQSEIEELRRDWKDLIAELDEILLQPEPIDQFIRISEAFSMACQELAVALVLEPFGHLIDSLTDSMCARREKSLDPRMSVSELQALVEKSCQWALDPDFGIQKELARFWYISEEKLEPRIGRRFEEPGAELERPLDTARQIQKMYAKLADWSGDLKGFLRYHPDCRDAVLRVQRLADYPYAEIHGNLVSGACRPIDMLRFKLAFFGATKFDPKSELWTRITLAQGAPLFDELQQADDWWLSALRG